MQVISYTHKGIEYRGFIYREFCPLLSLKSQYQNLGKTAWINPYNIDKWILTVALGKDDQEMKEMVA